MDLTLNDAFLKDLSHDGLLDEEYCRAGCPKGAHVGTCAHAPMWSTRNLPKRRSL